jgi:type IV pilus assembly protein PilO
MPRNFRLSRLNLKEPRVLMRVILGSLLAANLVVTLVVFQPWSASAEELVLKQRELEQQLSRAEARLAQTRSLAAKVEQARREGDEFLARYTTDRQSMSSIIYAELERAARDAGVKPRPLSIQVEEVEGSQTLHQMTITAAYEGSYANLTRFVNLVDKSPRFLIIEQMVASPQQSGALNVSFKLDTFVRQEPGSAL